MVKDNVKFSKTKKNGFRDDIDWKDIVKTLTPEDKKRITLWKELEEHYVKDDDAYAAGIRNDQLFQQYDSVLSNVEVLLSKILTSQREIEINKVSIMSGNVTKVYPGTNTKLNTRDLEIQNIMLGSEVNGALSQLWIHLYRLFKFVGVQRLDQKIFFSLEDYQAKIKYIKEELGKNGLELFKER